ncbi:hypothetical protein BB561_003710 [Smittium simulii]|uniref:Uncharacterized protein n=1 Tax=Smittium simulii TaxID=133385 RepID=A0A2T9YK01_9FUNG|nr:hypothetical protein BB561_003710 [Smittium simulii]
MQNAYFAPNHFLKNKSIPTAIRLKALQSVLILIGTYVGELFGMSEQRNSPIQKVSDQALRLIAGVGIKTALNRLRAEFVINTIKSKKSCLRERDYIKWPTSRLQDIGKIRTGSYWTCEKLGKLKFIQNIYVNMCPLCHCNVPENIEHILLDCSRWAVIRKDTIGQFIPRLYKLANLINNEPLKEARMELVGKLLGGESKLSLS